MYSFSNLALNRGVLLLIFLAVGCGTKDSKPLSTEPIEEYFPQEIEVETEEVKYDVLTKERLLNGKVLSLKKVVIKSEASGIIKNLNVYPGKKVNRGDIIFQADTSELMFLKKKYAIDLAESLVRKKDKLISSRNINEDPEAGLEIEQTIEILSGHKKAKAQLEEINHHIKKQTAIAPLSGIVANVEIEEFELIAKGQEICTIIDDKNFVVEFNLIENLVGDLKIGQKVKAKPLLNNGDHATLNATIFRINPIVNENGLVKVFAKVLSTNINLIDGMNVQLTLMEKVENQLIIPKSAVVKRSDRNVVFSVDTTTMLAKWNYVDISNESEFYFSVTAGLEKGEKVITSDNLFLDENTKVSIK